MNDNNHCFDMNRNEARRLTETVTNDQLREMFVNALNNITDWKKPSTVNKGITKGAAFNILAHGFDADSYDPNRVVHPLAKVNMIREFGEFLPDHAKPSKPIVSKRTYIHHENPKFKI